MQLSRTARYAVKALAYMAAHPESRLVPSYVVAQGIGASALLMLKVLNDLVGKGVLLSLRGPNGGYALARPPARISVLEAIEAVEGTIHGELPVDAPKGAVSHRLLALAEEIAEFTRDRLSRVSIADLAREGRVVGARGGLPRG